MNFLIKLLFILSLIIGSIYNEGYADNIQRYQKKQDSLNTVAGKQQTTDTTKKNPVQIDTNKIVTQIDTVKKDTVKKVDSLLVEPVKENRMTNTKLFIYILLSVLGLGLFYFLFVQTLFRTFHKTRSTRQSMLLSWNLFFIFGIIWIFIIWGIVASLWSSEAFMVVLIFLFIVSLIMLMISLKSK
jgi:hypothetical protein